jgi:hypothetical protein
MQAGIFHLLFCNHRKQKITQSQRPMFGANMIKLQLWCQGIKEGQNFGTMKIANRTQAPNHKKIQKSGKNRAQRVEGAGLGTEQREGLCREINKS